MTTAGPEQAHIPAVARAEGKSVSLPTAQLLTAVIVAPALVAGVWSAVVKMLGYPLETVTTGLAGAGVVSGVMFLSVLVMTPWKSRPMDLWMTFWMAGMVVRLLVTPVCTFLLYSAASLTAEPLALAVATTYLVTVLTETAVLARYVGKHC